jgi:hypothetical protein
VANVATLLDTFALHDADDDHIDDDHADDDHAASATGDRAPGART